MSKLRVFFGVAVILAKDQVDARANSVRNQEAI